MPRLIDVIASEVVGHSVNLMRYDATLRKQVLGIMENLQEDLVSKIAQADPTAAKTTSLRLQRARQLLADTTSTIDNYYNKAGAVAQKGLLGIAQIESNFSRKSINTLVGADLMSVSLDPMKLKKLADQTLVLGAPASEWWGRQSNDLKKNYADQIRMGVASGENISQITQRIRGKYTGRYIEVQNAKGVKRKVPEFTGGVLSASTRNAEALIITSVQSVANAARYESYQKNTDVIKGVQALATLDNRTTPMCRGRSGMSWDIHTGEPLDTKTNIKFPGPPPWHYRCRTTLVPVLRSWAELAGPKSKVSKAKLDELEAALPRKMQSSMDGQVSGDLNYEDWIKSKPEAFQKEVLGPGRWKLWTENKIGFADMIDQTGNSLTLLELEAKVGMPKPGSVEKVATMLSAIQSVTFETELTRGHGTGRSPTGTFEWEGESYFVKQVDPRYENVDVGAAISNHMAEFKLAPESFKVQKIVDPDTGFTYAVQKAASPISNREMIEGAKKYIAGASDSEKTRLMLTDLIYQDGDREFWGQYVMFEGRVEPIDFGSVFSINALKYPIKSLGSSQLISELLRGADFKLDFDLIKPLLSDPSLIALADRFGRNLSSLGIAPSSDFNKKIMSALKSSTTFSDVAKKLKFDASTLKPIPAPKVFKRGPDATYQAMEDLGYKDARTFFEDGTDSFKQWRVGYAEDLLGRPMSEYLDTFKQVGDDFDKVVFRTFSDDPNYASIGVFRREPYTEITRSFKRENGKLVVTHDHMEFDDSMHGKGISKRFSKASFEFYKKAGVDKVELYASMGNGGYTWARYGFLPHDVKEWGKVYDRLLSINNQEFQKFLASKTSRTDVRSLWTVADSKWGKEVLSGQSWEGSIDMNNKVQMDRLTNYLEIQ